MPFLGCNLYITQVTSSFFSLSVYMSLNLMGYFVWLLLKKEPKGMALQVATAQVSDKKSERAKRIAIHTPLDWLNQPWPLGFVSFPALARECEIRGQKEEEAKRRKRRAHQWKSRIRVKRKEKRKCAKYRSLACHIFEFSEERKKDTL